MLPRFVGIGEIHLLFQQERAQMFVDLLQRGVFEGFVGAFLRLSLVDFIEAAGLLFTSLMPASFFRIRPFAALNASSAPFALSSLVHCDDAFELFDVGTGIKRHPFNQRQNRSSAVQWWRGEMLNLLLHQNSSFSGLS